MRADPEFKALGAGGGPKCGCGWLDEAGVLEDLFGERAHATIVSETAALLSLIELNEARGARAQADARRGWERVASRLLRYRACLSEEGDGGCEGGSTEIG